MVRWKYHCDDGRPCTMHRFLSSIAAMYTFAWCVLHSFCVLFSLWFSFLNYFVINNCSIWCGSVRCGALAYFIRIGLSIGSCVFTSVQSKSTSISYKQILPIAWLAGGERTTTHTHTKRARECCCCCLVALECFCVLVFITLDMSWVLKFVMPLIFSAIAIDWCCWCLLLSRTPHCLARSNNRINRCGE